MHVLVKNEKKESRARPLQRQQQQPRTGPTVTNSSSSSLVEEKQQKRIAARAAAAMAQVLQRRREPRSLLMWGDRKKAVIKNYPDGSQEIIVPQTLTIEQEHYEFPPRSRFLKKLATSTAERKRFSIHQIEEHNTTTMKPDQFALQEWFSSSKTRINKSDRAVIDWINDVERSSKTLLKAPTPITPSGSTTNKIQFKSDAGKRWANSITSNTSLLPPDDKCRKHYVPRRLLLSRHRERHSPIHHDSATTSQKVLETDSKIQSMWKEYQATKRRPSIEKQIGLAAMESTGEWTPVAGLTHLIQIIKQSHKVNEQKLLSRMEQLQALLKEKDSRNDENLKRLNNQLFEKDENLKSLNNQLLEKDKTIQRLNVRISELEASLTSPLKTTSRKPSTTIPRKSSTVSTTPRKSATVSTTPRKSATVSTTPRKSATVSTPKKSATTIQTNKRKASTIVPLPPPTTRNTTTSTNKKLSSSVKPQPQSPNTSNTKRTRSLARTSSLANAGVTRTTRIINK